MLHFISVWAHWHFSQVPTSRPSVRHTSHIYQKNPVYSQQKSPTFDNNIRYVGLNILALLARADLKAIRVSYITYLSKEPYILSTKEPCIRQWYALSRSEYIGAACKCRSQGHQYVTRHIFIKRVLHSINERVPYLTIIYGIWIWIHWGCLRVLIARPSVRHISHIYQNKPISVNKRALHLTIIFLISVWIRWGCLQVLISRSSVCDRSHIPSKKPYILSK